MEKYTVFMDQKNQYSENKYSTQSNLQIQCNPYQATNGIFHRARTNNFTICMEIKKNLADEWIRKLWYIYTMEYYSAIKKNTFESVLMKWVKLEPI